MLENKNVMNSSLSTTNNANRENISSVLFVETAALEERVEAIIAESKNKITNKNEFKIPTKLEHVLVQDEQIETKPMLEYVDNFNSFVAKSAKSTLDMCRTVYEANKVLDSGEFYDFCKKIGFKDNSSTIRKFIVIGKVYPRLINYAEQLPIGWTNIYMLTQISAVDFDKCIKFNYSLKNLKGKDLKELLDKTKDINDIKSPFKYDNKEFGYRFGQIIFTKLPDDLDWYNVEKALNEVALRLPVKFQLNSEAKNKFISRRDSRYEKLKQEDEAMAYSPQNWDFGQVARDVIEM
jgi:hypothetical protein